MTPRDRCGRDSRSQGTRHGAAMGPWVGGLLLLATPAFAGLGVNEFNGHLGFGYTQRIGESSSEKRFGATRPAGSLTVAGGVDYPVAATMRAGVDIGYYLLGSATAESGSLLAELDYSVFEALALVHWVPPWRGGPLGRVSLGPGVFHARADLSSTGAPAFSDLAVEQTVGGGVVALTFIQRKPAPVRLGLEAGARRVFLRGDDWTILSARLTMHY